MESETPANLSSQNRGTVTRLATKPMLTDPSKASPPARLGMPPDPPLPVVAERLRQHFAGTGEPFSSIAEGVVLDIAAVLMSLHAQRQ